MRYFNVFNGESQLFENLKEKIETGFSLSDIESALLFIVCLRFIILSIRYNLKTSFYITCIGLFAGYLWYRHLIDLISMYRNILLKFSFLHSLGMDAIKLRSLDETIVFTDFISGENVSFFNPGQILFYAIFKKGIINLDFETKVKYYIDPISMLISRLKEPYKSNVLPFYYGIYTQIIPKLYRICSNFWNEISGIVTYAFITRIGKKYCPYLVRWHWTFLLMISLVEQILVYLIYRISYFQTDVLIPKMKSNLFNEINNLDFQIEFLNGILVLFVVAHIGSIIFGLFHAIWGQYFYFPFFVENTELHIGPRPKNSVYSGGFTSWQDYDQKNIHRLFPKLWFGWFGKTSSSGKLRNRILKLMKKLIKKVRKKFI